MSKAEVQNVDDADVDSSPEDKPEEFVLTCKRDIKEDELGNILAMAKGERCTGIKNLDARRIQITGTSKRIRTLIEVLTTGFHIPIGIENDTHSCELSDEETPDIESIDVQDDRAAHMGDFKVT